ncbi:MAG: L-threonylcarbamoyladenylate synthase [Pseudomonadota bacterium]
MMRIVLAPIDVKEAVTELARGGIVAYPTETYYGLGVDAENPVALERLASLKGRDVANPFPILLPDSEHLARFTGPLPSTVLTLTEHFWPGPLTLILKSHGLPDLLKGPSGGIGFRVSSHPVAHALLSEFGRCVTATSANLTGEKPASSMEELRAYFGKTDILALDAGDTPGGAPSTVLDLTDPKEFHVVREGAIAIDEIRAVLK